MGRSVPEDEKRRLPRLAPPRDYEVGYGKPPSHTRFKPGESGNPRGRPRGSRNAQPSFSEERIKTLIIEEAYRTIPSSEGPPRLDPHGNRGSPGCRDECSQGQ